MWITNVENFPQGKMTKCGKQKEESTEEPQKKFLKIKRNFYEFHNINKTRKTQVEKRWKQEKQKRREMAKNHYKIKKNEGKDLTLKQDLAII